MPETRFVTLRDFSERLAKDPELLAQVREEPLNTIRSVMASPRDTDPWIYRLVVSALGLAVVLTVVGSVALAVMQQPVPDVLLSLASAAVGALAGLLAPSPGRSG